MGVVTILADIFHLHFEINTMLDCDVSDGQFKFECLFSRYKRSLNLSHKLHEIWQTVETLMFGFICLFGVFCGGFWGRKKYLSSTMDSQILVDNGWNTLVWKCSNGIKTMFWNFLCYKCCCNKRYILCIYINNYLNAYKYSC